MTGGYPSGNSAFRCLTHGTTAERRAPWFDVEYTRLFRITAEDIYVDVRYPAESGEPLRVPFERPVHVSSDEFRAVDGNGRGPVAVPHDPCHYYPPCPFAGSTLTVGRDTGYVVHGDFRPNPIHLRPMCGSRASYYTEHIECHLDTPTVPAMLSLA